MKLLVLIKRNVSCSSIILNPFPANVPISYALKTPEPFHIPWKHQNPFYIPKNTRPHFISLKTPEKLWFSGVFRGYKMGTLTGNGLSAPKNLCFPNSTQGLIKKKHSFSFGVGFGYGTNKEYSKFHFIVANLLWSHLQIIVQQIL